MGLVKMTQLVNPTLDITMPAAVDIARVYVARRVFERMVQAAVRHPEDETGEALVGLMIPNDSASNRNAPHKLYLLDTIAPGADAVREWAMFEQGSQWQDDVFQWYYENWELYRQLRRASYGKAVAAKWDVPLRYLGDWHKQPGMVQPSRGDFRTAKRFMKAQQLEYMVTPIVTFAHEVPADDKLQANTTLVESATLAATIRIDYWIIYNNGSRFERVQPVLVENEDLPRLPPLPWHLADPERFGRELDKLEADGIKVLDIVQRKMRQHPPLDTCLVLHRTGAQFAMIAITGPLYPHRCPDWRVAPLLRPRGDEDFFELLYRVSSPIADVLPGWTSEDSLLDAAHALEAKHQP